MEAVDRCQFHSTPDCNVGARGGYVPQTDGRTCHDRSDNANDTGSSGEGGNGPCSHLIWCQRCAVGLFGADC
eukprot:7249304-Karenia_brevis.AAC.1